MFGRRKQLWKELTMLEATVKELASHTKEQIDGLRNDMAAEFVKRDDMAAEFRSRNALADALANLEKRLKNTEEFVGVQTDSIAAVILACGLREGNKFMDASEQIKREKEKLSQIIAKARAKYEAPKVEKIEATKPEAEPALEAEETLFSDLEKKKRNKRLVAPHPGMKQLRSWALHYGMTQREFSWGMSRLGYPIRKSEGGRDKGSCWLYPDEAERIYVEIKDQR